MHSPIYWKEIDGSAVIVGRERVGMPEVHTVLAGLHDLRCA